MPASYLSPELASTGGPWGVVGDPPSDPPPAHQAVKPQLALGGLGSPPTGLPWKLCGPPVSILLSPILGEPLA